MNCIIVLFAFAAVVFAQPSNLYGSAYGRNGYPLNYASPYGRTVQGSSNVYYTHFRDSPEVSAAKSQQAADRVNEKFSMAANEAARNVQYYARTDPGFNSAYHTYGGAYSPSYPTRTNYNGPDEDSPEVAAAKFHQAVTHVSEKYDQAADLAARNEATMQAARNQATIQAARNQGSYARFADKSNSGYTGYDDYSPSYRTSGGYEERVVDTPEVAAAKVQHAAAYVTEGINHAREVAKNEAVFKERNLSGPYYGRSYEYEAPVERRTYESPVVAFIKVQHAAAHVNEGINHAREVAKNEDVYRERNLSGPSNSGYSSPFLSQDTVHRDDTPVRVYDSRT